MSWTLRPTENEAEPGVAGQVLAVSELDCIRQIFGFDVGKMEPAAGSVKSRPSLSARADLPT